MSMTPELVAIIEKYNHYPEFLGIEIYSVNQPGALDNTLLHLATWIGAIDDMQILISSGADVNSAGDLENTPLHLASMKGRGDAVVLLLESKADVMRQNQFGQTPDRVADLAGHGDLSALLRDSILIKKK
jgi:ankyrin repeat protein